MRLADRFQSREAPAAALERGARAAAGGRIAIGIGQKVSLRYQVMRLDRAGCLLEVRPFKKNLIVDQGLDGIATRTWADSFVAAVVGTGVTPFRRDTGATTLSRAANTVTASAGFFEAADVGRLIKMDTGEEMKVTVFTDAQHVTVDQAGAIAATPGTVWYVNRVGLAAEVKRTTTYGSDGGDNVSSFVRPTWTMQRTFIFGAEAGLVTYNEIAWSWTAVAGNNIFGGDIISGGISLGAGQQLKVIVQVSVTLTPDTSTAWTNPGGGWVGNGVHCCETASISVVDGSGNTANTYGGALNANIAQTTFLATATTALVPMDLVTNKGITGILPQTKLLAKSAYVAGTFTQEQHATFAVADDNSTLIRTLGIQEAGAGYRRYSVLMDSAQTKDSSHTLTVGFTWSWGRVLTN